MGISPAMRRTVLAAGKEDIGRIRPMKSSFRAVSRCLWVKRYEMRMFTFAWTDAVNPPPEAFPMGVFHDTVSCSGIRRADPGRQDRLRRRGGGSGLADILVFGGRGRGAWPQRWRRRNSAKASCSPIMRATLAAQFSEPPG